MPNQALHIVGGLATDPATSPGFYVADGDGLPIDIDADGDYGGNTTRIVIDLSRMLSYRLGKQIPMTATFRVNYLRVSPRNVDDVNDNNDSQYFAGDWEWYHPNKHRVDAVQAWRMLEKRLEEDDADAEGLFVSSEDRYKGFRFGFYSSADVDFPSEGAPVGQLPGGYGLVPMIQAYHTGLKNGGVPTQTNALWDRMVGRTSHMGWSCSVSNEDDVGKNAFIQDYEWTAPAGHNIEVMGGLMVFNITHSSTDTSNVVDDDFNFQIDIGVSGWSSW